jgi:hypothetical protein
MRSKGLGALTLTIGPVLISALFLKPWINDLSSRNWMFLEPWFRLWFSIIVPGLGGFILGMNQGKDGFAGTLLYVPSAMISSVLFVITQAILDPVREGAAEFAFVVWFISLFPMIILGVVFAFLGGGLGFAVRSFRYRSPNGFAHRHE